MHGKDPQFQIVQKECQIKYMGRQELIFVAELRFFIDPTLFVVKTVIDAGEYVHT